MATQTHTQAQSLFRATIEGRADKINDSSPLYFIRYLHHLHTHNKCIIDHLSNCICHCFFRPQHNIITAESLGNELIEEKNHDLSHILVHSIQFTYTHTPNAYVYYQHLHLSLHKRPVTNLLYSVHGICGILRCWLTIMVYYSVCFVNTTKKLLSCGWERFIHDYAGDLDGGRLKQTS